MSPSLRSRARSTLDGEIFGDVHMENIAGPMHLHTSVTELQLAALPGDMTLNSDDLRVTEAKGQVRVTTRSKDVDLSQIYGDTYVATTARPDHDCAGRCVQHGGQGGKGDVELTLPPEACGDSGRSHPQRRHHLGLRR